MNVDTGDREDLLRWASRLTKDAADVVAVSSNALPLLEWAEAAANTHDLQARMAAMRQHHQNRMWTAEPDDDPAAFVRAATILYNFLIDGRPAQSSDTELSSNDWPEVQYDIDGGDPQ